MAGRPKKPTALKVIQGNPGKRALPEHEPKPERGTPCAPAHFGGTARDWFAEAAAELDKIGVLTLLDGNALELLIEAYAEYRQHCEELDAEGYTYRTTSTTGETVIKAHPAAAMKSDAWKRVRAMLGEFGMTPASRAKVSTKHGGEEDPLQAFLNSKR
ncbi:TPA: phage terminase small subunit P27 family [Klebsiella aerogenes]|nr:phage terminase small subunit P27 family [Klebsiella aerogenes]